MTHLEKLIEIAKQHNGIVTAAQATSKSIPRRCLTEAVEKHLFDKASRGVYILPEVWEDELFILQYKYPKGIFSHETALYLLGLSDRTPGVFNMTFPKGYNITAAKNTGVNCNIVNRENYELGRIEINSPCNNTIRIYNRERTLCDIVKGNNTCDIQIVTAAMKAYARSKDKNLMILFEYATQLQVLNKVQRYMEVLL